MSYSPVDSTACVIHLKIRWGFSETDKEIQAYKVLRPKTLQSLCQKRRIRAPNILECASDAGSLKGRFLVAVVI
jgi:hypothetical protein